VALVFFGSFAFAFGNVISRLILQLVLSIAPAFIDFVGTDVLGSFRTGSFCRLRVGREKRELIAFLLERISRPFYLDRHSDSHEFAFALLPRVSFGSVHCTI
jgi:hypothetical protein